MRSRGDCHWGNPFHKMLLTLRGYAHSFFRSHRAGRTQQPVADAVLTGENLRATQHARAQRTIGIFALGTMKTQSPLLDCRLGLMRSTRPVNLRERKALALSHHS